MTRLSFTGPDEAVRMYFEWSRSSGTAHSFDPTAMRGRLYVARCPSCGGKRKEPNDEGEFRCARCSRMWPWEFAEVLKDSGRRRPRRLTGKRMSTRGQPHGSHGHRFGHLDALSDLGKVLATLPEDSFRVYGLYLIENQTRETTAARANALHYPPGAWTDRKVRTAIKTCRRLLDHELSRRGWIASGEAWRSSSAG